MPNWCYNYLTVKGEQTELQRFVDAITLDDGDYDLSRIYPTPEPLVISESFWGEDTYEQATPQERAKYDDLNARYESNLATYGHRSWYGWNCANWGTKWSPRVEDFYFDLSSPYVEVEIRFDTAWSPATGLMTEISRRFPTLVFDVSFDEESQAYVGCEVFSNGEVFASSYDPNDYDSLPAGWADVMRETYGEYEKRAEANDDHSWEYWHDWSDACQELREFAENEAWERYAKATEAVTA